VAPDNMSITMTTSRTVPYYFLQLVGLSSGTVKPIAKAGIHQDTEGARGLISVGLPCTATSCNYTTGTLYHLVQAGTNGNGGSWNVGPGNWGRLALGGQVRRSSKTILFKAIWVRSMSATKLMPRPVR
jgi:hypothetical protein